MKKLKACLVFILFLPIMFFVGCSEPTDEFSSQNTLLSSASSNISSFKAVLENSISGDLSYDQREPYETINQNIEQTAVPLTSYLLCNSLILSFERYGVSTYVEKKDGVYTIRSQDQLIVELRREQTQFSMHITEEEDESDVVISFNSNLSGFSLKRNKQSRIDCIIEYVEREGTCYLSMAVLDGDRYVISQAEFAVSGSSVVSYKFISSKESSLPSSIVESQDSMMTKRQSGVVGG